VTLHDKLTNIQPTFVSARVFHAGIRIPFVQSIDPGGPRSFTEDACLLQRKPSFLVAKRSVEHSLSGVSEWVSSFLTAHQHIIGYSVSWQCG